MRTGPLTFARFDDRRVVAGVAGGFGRQHGVDPLLVRGALIVLTFAAGLGLALYALGAAMSVDEGARLPPVTAPDSRRNLSVVAITLGLLAIVRSTGVWLGDTLMVPLVVVVAGLVVLGMARGAGSLRSSASARFEEVMSGRHARSRVLVGASLVAFGLVMVSTGTVVPGALRVGAFATAVSILGVALVIGPWITRLAQAAAEDRRERIRSEEREAMAAHLHDSVLQTLALIQRTAEDPRRTASLARQQEHELREWLFGSDSIGTGSFVGEINDIAREVEQRYTVRVDVVAVGDAPLDDDLAALGAAAREACVNGAKHSGEAQISVYVEVTETSAEVFVRDRGRGFDRHATPADRQGIAQSIEGRMIRIGGTSFVESAPGAGTEVHLALPRRVPTDRSGR